MQKNRHGVVLLLVYEAFVALLLVARFWPEAFRIDPERISDVTETILWLTVVFLPVLIPYIQSLDIKLPGGTRLELKRLEARIEKEKQRLDRVTYEAERIVHSLTSLLFTPSDGALSDVANRLAKRRTVVVGCTQFTEQRLLCAIIAELLRHRGGFDRVIAEYGLGGAARNFVALARGGIDLFPHYTWTGFELLYPTLLTERRKRREWNQMEPEHQIRELNTVFRQKPYPLDWTTLLGFQNDWVMVMRSADAQERNIESLSDVSSWDGHLTLGCEPEFRYRTSGFGTLLQPPPNGYGLEFKEVKVFSHREVYEALREGEVDIIDGFTTDPYLENGGARGPFQPIVDDREIFGHYHAAIIARGEFLDACHTVCPEIREVLQLLPFTEDELAGEDSQARWQRELGQMIRTAEREKRRANRIPRIESLAKGFLERRDLI